MKTSSQKTKKVILYTVLGLSLLSAVAFFQADPTDAAWHRHHRKVSSGTTHPSQTPAPSPAPTPAPAPAPTPAPVQTSKSFSDNFAGNLTLEETGSMSESPSPNWWVNSGALFYINNSIGSTVQGSLPTGSAWQKEYASSNPVDTDGGYHPQNIFRLVTKSKWQNLSQEAYYKITKDNLSASSERYESNGLLLFNRYVDSDNLYYTGVRVDGTAIIKKKIGGNYYTMAQVKIFPGTYNHDSNPDLLPHNSWIGLRSEVTNNADGTVTVKIYVDKDGTGNWILGASALDNGKNFGGKAITSTGFAGIRTDFMDVQFKNYQVSELN